MSQSASRSMEGRCRGHTVEIQLTGSKRRLMSSIKQLKMRKGGELHGLEEGFGDLEGELEIL